MLKTDSGVALLGAICYNKLIMPTCYNRVQQEQEVLTMPQVKPIVTLISHTPQPERTVAAAARLCYSPAHLDEVFDGMTPEKAAGFVDMLSENGHQSPIEHASFTFGIEGVSRALLAQITRHRIASFSVQSQRYVVEDGFDYVIPPEIEKDAQAKALFVEAMDQAQRAYSRLLEQLARTHEAAMAADGMDPKRAKAAARKKAAEDARFVLPNACDTKMVVTMNARSLYNFFSLRCCNRAQWEIREVARQMLALVLKVAPHLFAKAGPPCVSGPCTEGRMSCGKAKEVREAFASLRGERQ